MQSVKINASKSYEVIIGKNVLNKTDSFFLNSLNGKKAMIVADDIVYDLYGQLLESVLTSAGIKSYKFVFPHGEAGKNLTVYGQIVEEMCAFHLSRDDVLIALGGGVCGDMAGFAAATYQRGIDFVTVPTTLLAAVDSSVGGKTAINLKNGKNQIGVFWQPIHVLCDIDTLQTLPKEEYQNGCAEVIKYAMLSGQSLFEQIKNKSICDQYEDVISKCVSIKRDYVERDELDTGERMFLNFGHTIGHGIEARSGYTIPHGRSVAIGMALITHAAANLGYCEMGVYGELVSILKQYGLPFETSFSITEISEAIMSDKKSHGDYITLVVPRELGRCELVKINKSETLKWLEAAGLRNR